MISRDKWSRNLGRTVITAAHHPPHCRPADDITAVKSILQLNITETCCFGIKEQTPPSKMWVGGVSRTLFIPHTDDGLLEACSRASGGH